MARYHYLMGIRALGLLAALLLLVAASASGAGNNRRRNEKAINLLPTTPLVERYCDKYPRMRRAAGQTRRQLCEQCCATDKGEPGEWLISSVVSTYCYCKPKPTAPKQN